MINNAEPTVKQFVSQIEEIIKLGGYDSQVSQYRDCLEIDINKYAAVILSGSPQGDDIVEHHLPYFGWIKEFEKPLFVICAGHHITGALFGSELLRSKEPESGDVRINILKDDPLFVGLKKSLVVKQMHNDSITLPKNFKLLASSEICKNQLMKHESRPLYTCQFHPEFYNHDLIHNFLEIACETF